MLVPPISVIMLLYGGALRILKSLTYTDLIKYLMINVGIKNKTDKNSMLSKNIITNYFYKF